jgi:putative cell wall-binding protein
VLFVSARLCNFKKAIVKLGLNVDRLCGDTRQDTNAAVINKFYSVGKELYDNGGIIIAKSDNLGLVDALGSGAFGSKLHAPVVLASDELSEDQKDVLGTVKNKEHKVQVGYGIGSLVMDYFN